MCALEFPDLEKSFWQKYKSKDVVVFGMAQGGLSGGDTPERLKTFVSQTGITFPILIGTGGLYRKYQLSETISPFPLDVIIDKQGKIAYIAGKFDAAAMEQVVQRLLKGSK